MLPELSNAEAKIALMLGIVFDGENPSLRKISKKTKMNYNTVKKAIIELKGKGII
jgi:DNA-binding transcriptional regulator YhcF (GntR family)